MKTKMFRSPWWIALLGLFFIVACQSSKPGGSSHAAVEIKGRSVTEIQTTAVVVFGENGFTLRTNTPIMMVFDRPASTSEKVKYGDWLNDGMLMLVKVRLQSLPNDLQVLSADVYRVQDPANPSFRDEHRLMLVSAKYYRKLLEDIALRLDNSPPK